MSASQAMKFTVTTTDEQTYEVTAIFADLIRYDVLRNKHGYPTREDSQFLFMGLVSFCSLLRTGQVAAGTNPDTFLNTLAAIEPVESEEDEAEFPAGA